MQVRLEQPQEAVRIDLTTSEDEYYINVTAAKFEDGGKLGQVYLSLPVSLAKELQTKLTETLKQLEVKV